MEIVKAKQSPRDAIRKESWTSQEVGAWLDSICLSSHMLAFASAGIEGRHLEMLTEVGIKAASFICLNV